MLRFHIACCRTEYGYYFIDAEDEAQAKGLAQEKLVTGKKFDWLCSTLIGMSDTNESFEIVEPPGFDSSLPELVHIPKEEGA
jgi:hypothetical protein